MNGSFRAGATYALQTFFALPLRFSEGASGRKALPVEQQNVDLSHGFLLVASASLPSEVTS